MNLHFPIFISNLYLLLKFLHKKNSLKKRKNILNKIIQSPPQIMSSEIIHSKLHHTFILSSHNSYIENFQNFDTTEIEIIEFLLKVGVRCLEFDVYFKNNQLVIGHGTKNILNGSPIDLDFISTTVLPLDQVFQLIAKNAFLHSDMPLFINLELLTRANPSAHIQISNLILHHFHNLLPNHSFQYANQNLGQCNIKQLRKKIFFISGRKLDNMDPLKKYIHAHTYKIDEIPDINNIDPKWILNFPSHQIKQPEHKKIIQNHIQNMGLVRVFPPGGILNNFGWNFDFETAMQIGIQFISMNIQQMNHGVEKYLEKFVHSPIKKKSEILHL